jgi:uncharacterized protein (TIGR03435 family)
MPEALTNHLWQSTAFAAIAGLLTLAFRSNRARVRHWLWFAASVKFLIPLALFIGLGQQIEFKSTPVQPSVTAAVQQIVEPFTAQAVSVAAPAESRRPDVIFMVWLVGVLAISASWLVRWLRVRGMVRSASPWESGIMVSDTNLEPGVFGVFRPVLLLPKGIFDRLTPAQLRAIIAHEMCHIRHHDNLLAAIHMFVETIFWFHPLVWWIGKRMVEERELACDEEVLRTLGEPQAYAEGILSVCKLYIESPLPCVSGVTGADLKKRIEVIMKNAATFRLSVPKKLILAAAGIAAVAVPLSVGILRGQQGGLLADLGEYSFEVATIRPGKPDGDKLMGIGVSGRPGRWEGTGVTLKDLILAAYGVSSEYVYGGPKWIDSNAWDIVAQAPEGQGSYGQLGKLLQTLLRDRFHLRMHTEQRQMPVFELKVIKPGKLTRSIDCMAEIAKGDASTFNGICGLGSGPGNPRTLGGGGATMTQLTQYLSRVTSIARPVLDRTGLDGFWNFEVKFMPANPDGSENPLAPPIAIAIQEQLGLKLESSRAAVEVLVVDQAEMPDQN